MGGKKFPLPALIKGSFLPDLPFQKKHINNVCVYDINNIYVCVCIYIIRYINNVCACMCMHIYMIYKYVCVHMFMYI